MRRKPTKTRTLGMLLALTALSSGLGGYVIGAYLARGGRWSVPTRQDLPSLREDARKAWEAKAYSKARPLLEQILNLEPDDEVANLQLGSILAFDTTPVDTAGARRHLERAIKIRRSPETLRTYGQFLTKRAQFREAEGILLEAMASREGRFATAWCLGYLSWRRRQYDKAAEYFGRCAALGSNDKTCKEWEGKSREQASRTSKDSRIRGLLSEAGNAWTDGDYEVSKGLWEEVLGIDPTNFDANQFLGTYYMDFASPSDPVLAVKHYARALKQGENPALRKAYQDALASAP